MIKVRCPICERIMEGERLEWPQFPFCSPRCKQIDLGRWLGEGYRFPTQRDSAPDTDDGTDVADARKLP